MEIVQRVLVTTCEVEVVVRLRNQRPREDLGTLHTCETVGIKVERIAERPRRTYTQD